MQTGKYLRRVLKDDDGFYRLELKSQTNKVVIKSEFPEGAVMQAADTIKRSKYELKSDDQFIKLLMILEVEALQQ